ncbi:Pimeloyl-ACP methyl ester carboxylesterase [Saccharopolyspora antimicrobica]|uniref:Pimeloyl-ACP methyl ester carboxylesterase n=1 Tax=Saccharopolyspora antimicrobica TaxID=455193 RepID=A0A1I5EB88_9PSEU|nr:alpha/beta hydrolase [Saccharopolyspora antimicrobica]RKT86749.1 pimeloyl-ACP methyl ester carboxylesterase [Saccharopolyspora antimicrobica]SFO08782.1 Pimeloyl-ACP methyl ester carboxylesterase [Saccharopolyspora antimicrobica]
MPSDEVALVNGLRVHYTTAGSGPGLVLLHGWPQTSHCWRKLIPELARTHTVIAPDLRGYGRTDKPRDGYDKRTMAADMAELVAALGFDSVSVVGHDRGARVAHRWGLDRPDQVDRLALLDIVPTREMWRLMNTEAGTAYWHWFFHLQPDLPERLVGNDVAGYLGYFFERWTVNRHGLETSAIEEYVRAFSAPGALRAGFDDYRASFPLDSEHDDADAEAGRKLTMPVLALWGSAGLPAKLPMREIWRDYAEHPTCAEIADCGHFLAEERPEQVLAHLREFLAPGR